MQRKNSNNVSKDRRRGARLGEHGARRGEHGADSSAYRGATSSAPGLILKPGREKSIERGHPWLFSGAIEQVNGAPRSGDVVAIRAIDGRFLAWAGYSEQSQIRARVWSRDETARIDAAWLAARIAASAARRGGVRLGRAARLVNAENDGLPGIIIDHYDHTAVVQLLSAGADIWRDEITRAIGALASFTCIYERSDAEVRVLEGLTPRTGPLVGSAPAGPVEFLEAVNAHCDARYCADVVSGHKTGFYLDQSSNRAQIAALAAGADVLNCFSYTGGFAIAALLGGARHALSIESSADALTQARSHQQLNSIAPARAEWLEGDVFATLRTLRDQAKQFDLVILDPPKFAPTAAHVERAARAYKDINLLALKLLRPGGHLVTFSCSGAIDYSLFRSIVAGAAQDAKVGAHIIGTLGPAKDHTVALHFPEGDYLKGFLLEKE